MIEARRLVKHYRSTPAVDNLSFDVRPGHRDRLPWPNGAAKATAFRLLERHRPGGHN
jgi:ABC-type branched-subunit amino acid transport system ATPase component